MATTTSISPATRERVLARLGLDGPVPADPGGLADLYQRWCRAVPFDNVRKLIALRNDEPGDLPGMDPADFFAHWLDHGVGGTCWPGTSALSALCAACGFDTRMVAASMGDIGEPTHGTTVVTLDGSEWLVDSSMLTDQPLRLADHETAIAHPVFATTATPVEEGWLFAFPLSFAEATMPCRTMSPDGVTHDFCVGRYEWSRSSSPFNQQVSTRRNDAEGVVSYGGAKRYRRTAAGVEESALADAALAAALVEELGLSEEIVDRLARSG